MKNTKKIFLMLFSVFAASVFFWSVLEVTAQSADNMAPLSQSRQSGGVFLLLAQNNTGEDTRYNPAKIYRGSYGTNMLFYKIPTSLYWRKVSNDFTTFVTCSDARMHLKLDGTWKGHLNKKGGCGPVAEPSDWITGNRLNYEDALEAEQ
jgi:hypothetical protein